MVSKKTKEDGAAFRRKLKAAMADYTPPTLEEMVEEGQRLFKPSRHRAQPQKISGTALGRRRRVSAFPNETPSEEHSVNQTLAVLLGDIRQKRPRHETDPDWTFAVGGKREYVAISTQGPDGFSAQYPVWKGQNFVGCVMADIKWPVVRRVLERFYVGSPLSDCFAGIEGTLMPYAAQKRGRRK